MIRFIRLGSPALFALLLLIFAALSPAAAQAQLEEEKAQLERLSLSLDTVEREFANTTPSSERLAFLEDLLSEIKSDAQEVADTASQRLEPLNRQREALGEAPSEEEGQSESEDVASERSALNERISEIKGVQQQAGVVIARSDQLLRRLNELANQQTAERILLRGKSLLEPGSWREALLQARDLVLDLAARPAAWWSNARPARVGWLPYLWALGSGLFAFVLSWILRRWLLRRYGRDPEAAEPSYARRVLAAGILGLSQGLVRSLAVLAFFFVLKRSGLITESIEPIANGIVIAVVFALVVAQMSRAALAPSVPQWGIVPLDRPTSQHLGRLTVLFAFVLAVLIGIAFAAEIWTYEGQAFASLFALVSNSISAVFLLRFLGSWLWRKHQTEEEDEDKAESGAGKMREDEEEEQGPEPLAFPWQLARLGLCVLVLAIPVTALFGYANLSHYIAGGLIFSAIVICAAVMTWAVFEEAVSNLFSGDGRSGQLRRRLSLPDSANALVFWFKLIAAVALACGTLLLLLLIWGVPQTTLGLWVGEFLDGIRIGEFTISPGDIFVAILVLVVALFVTRLLRRLLTERVLPRTKLDPGVRFSISAAASYAGVALAILLSISALGLDLSNLAIIAGALSVGIGFGLQNVVNNFVSGILLLIERPIKVGDWVIVGNFEGTVRRISVRSTEIETFDRSEVIVPNSDLISSPVVNWTHKTRMARLKIAVGVAYGTDTKQVHDILLDLAKQHEKVASYPEPYVLFMGFGDSSLDFELRIYVQDVDYFLSVPSDINFAIDAAFREAKIEIPFPQRDLHIKDQPKSDKEAPTETPEPEEDTPPSSSARDVPEGDAS